MRPIWMLTVVAVVAAGPALAQGLIAPSRQYKTPEREKLDKSYGLPTFGTPGESMPKQQTTPPPLNPTDRPDAFAPMPSFAKPDTRAPNDTPDFFQKPSGLASSESGVPNFFQDRQDIARPRSGAGRGGETPMFTTDEGLTTGGTTTGGTRPDAATDD